MDLLAGTPDNPRRQVTIPGVALTPVLTFAAHPAAVIS